MLLVFFVIATSLSGCLNEDSSDKAPIVIEESLPDGTFITNSTGMSIEGTPLAMDFYFSNVGEQGAESEYNFVSEVLTPIMFKILEPNLSLGLSF